MQTILRKISENLSTVKISTYTVVYRTDALLLQCETWKRFSDLQLLHKHLESVHLRSQPTSNLPELVRAKYFGKLTGGRRGGRVKEDH